MAVKRVSNSPFVKLLQAAACPVCVFDARRNVVFANEALCHELGCQSAELIGKAAVFHSEPTGDVAQDAANGCCPPPHAFAGEIVSIALDPLEARDGGAQSSSTLVYIPLGISEAEDGVLMIMRPMTAGETTADLTVGNSPREQQTPPEWWRLHQELASLRAERELASRDFPLIGHHPAIARIGKQVAMLAPTATAAAIIGPRGAPRKELAEHLHARTPQRNRGRFLWLSCDALSEEDLHETVFSFLASGGRGGTRIDTVLLDGIDRLPPAQAPRSHEFFSRLANEVRLLAAAETLWNGDGTSGTEQQTDAPLGSLFGAAEIRIPPLADRKGDVPLIAQAIVESLNRHTPSGRSTSAGGALHSGEAKSGFSASAMDDLCLADWPGDVAELRDVVTRAWGNAEQSEIQQRDLPRGFREKLEARGEAREAAPLSIHLESYLAEIETKLIRRALAQARGNKTKAADLLGMTRPRFYRRLSQLGLEDADAVEDKSD